MRALLFVLSAFVWVCSGFAQAESEIRASDNQCFWYTEYGWINHSIAITQYDANCSKNVVIPTHLDGKKVVYIKRQAMSNMGITDISIPDGISFDWGSFEGNPVVAYSVVEYSSISNRAWLVRLWDWAGQNPSIDRCDAVMKERAEDGGFLPHQDLGLFVGGFFFDANNPKKVTFFEKCTLSNGSLGAVLKPVIGKKFEDSDSVTFFGGIQKSIPNKTYWAFSHTLEMNFSDLKNENQTIKAIYDSAKQTCSAGIGGNACVRYPNNEQVEFVKSAN